MSALPAVNQALGEELPAFEPTPIAGSYWNLDWRDRYLVASDEIRNHMGTAFLGVLDGTEGVTDWNPWEGVTGPHPDTVLRFGYGAPALQVYPNPAPLAIDAWNLQNTNGQVQLTAIEGEWAAGMVPPFEPPQGLPYHYDVGDQIDMGQAIGPRQVFRQPPSISDQTAAVYAAGF